jgi:hypothetical protein
MSAVRLALLAGLLACGTQAWCQQPRRDPHIGYLYPAGGRRGSTFCITIGGQNLRGTSDVCLNGTGVHARFIQRFPPLRNVSPEQGQALASTMRRLLVKRWAELEKAGRVGPLPPGLRDLCRPKAAASQPTTSAPVELPQTPLLYGLEHKSLRELLHTRYMLVALKKGQPNPQIAESVLVEVSIDDDAALGEREIRLDGRLGLSNPMAFEVGALPETYDLEGDDSRLAALLPAETPLQLPVVLNGQIMPGDADCFRFSAAQGQGLVIETHARRLIPYLADAVPGWFQAAVTLYDASGNEVAFADDYRFDPDPVLYYKVPVDGEYELEIRDALYRGRQDFVYRVTVGEQPFITSVFPLGTKAEHERYVRIDGWNLTTDRLFLDPGHNHNCIDQKCLGMGTRMSNRVAYAVDDLPTSPESEPDDSLEAAQRIALPRIIDGRIGQPGDIDVFQFNGKPGSELVAEIMARRVNSPLDSLLRLLDANGNVLAWNDDYEHKEGVLHMDTGVQTHSADSYLRATLPADGLYYLQVSDAQGQGGPAYGYRLRVSPPRPDFALRVTPSSVNVPPAGAAVLTVYALRKDGFGGEIEVSLEDPPPGFQLGGATVPAGRDRIRMTLTVSRPAGRGPGAAAAFDQPLVLKLAGRAQIGRQLVRHDAVPAEDLMQAFLYRHLTPSQELMVAARGKRPPPMKIAGATPIRVPPGGTAEVCVNVPQRLLDRGLDFELSDPLPGITLEKVTQAEGAVVLLLKADAHSAHSRDNLIVEAFTAPRPQRAGQAAKPPARTSLGFLPAIPIAIAPG